MSLIQVELALKKVTSKSRTPVSMFFSILEGIRKGSDLPKKSGGHRASNKNIRRSSYRKVHQLYFLLSFDSVRTLEIHDVASTTSCIACALEMRSSNGRI